MNSSIIKMKNLTVACLAVVLSTLTSPSQAGEASIEVHADHVCHRLSRYLTGACIEDVNHEVYGGLYSQMIFGESFQEPGLTHQLPFPPAGDPPSAISSQWRPIISDDARASFDLVTNQPFVGAQSQHFVFKSGAGEVGI